MEEKAEFVTIVDHDDYEILSTYPHTIRRKNDHRVCSETMNNDGYLIVTLNGKIYQKHRIIASQFIATFGSLGAVVKFGFDLKG